MFNLFDEKLSRATPAGLDRLELLEIPMDIGASASAPELSEGFTERLCDAYRSFLGEFSGPGDSMWASIDGLRENIHIALLQRNIGELRELLTTPLATKLYFGVDELYDHGAPIGPSGQESYAAGALKYIQSMAAILGAARYPNPEGGELYERGNAPAMPPPDTLLNDLERLVGVPLEFPNPFFWGVRTANGAGNCNCPIGCSHLSGHPHQVYL